MSNFVFSVTFSGLPAPVNSWAPSSCIEANNHMHALEKIFAACNHEPHSDTSSALVAQEYAQAGLRSMSVGDMVTLHTPDGNMKFRVADIGWERLEDA